MEDSEINIYSWGFSKYGQTGLYNCQFTDVPNKLNTPLLKEVISISNGEFNSSFTFNDNNSYIYGINTFGQLGGGDYKSKKLSEIPLLLPIKFKKLSLGGGHVLGISTDNKLYSWGLNIFGQLGLGHNNNIDEPKLVEKISFYDQIPQEYGPPIIGLAYKNFPEDKNVIDIKAGPQHSLFLLSDNTIYSCGFTKFGALGYSFNNNNSNNNNSNNNNSNNNNENDPNSSNIFTIIELEKNFSFNKENDKITKIEAGISNSACVINDKSILIWGYSEDSNLNGYKNFNISELVKVNNEENSEEIVIKDFKIGKNFVVILTNTGIILTEGINYLGQLGRPDSEEKKELFGKVDLPEKIENIFVGYEFVYAMTGDKKIYAWGCNKFGQIPGWKNNVCNKPFFMEKITKLNPILISCGGYHISALCKSNSESTEFVKYFKNYPINKCLNNDEQRQKKIYYEKINKVCEEQNEKQNKFREKQDSVKKLLDECDQKQILEKFKNAENMSPEDYQKVDIEKLLNEEIDLEELVFPEDSMIGKGAFGEVKKAYFRKTLVSVKFLKQNFESDEKQVSAFIEEYNLLKQLRHPNILFFLGGNTRNSPHFLVTEFCDNGTLFEFLHVKKRAEELTDIDRLALALEIAKGMNYLHSFKPPMLHRDLKSLNVFLDKNKVAKIADFGWAKLRNNHMTKQRGTFQWMAPEVVTKENYTEKADVFSYGIILSEFWSNDPPYKGVKAKEVAIRVKINPNFRPNIPSTVPEKIVNLMKACWDADPNKRPSFLEIINSIEECIVNL